MNIAEIIEYIEDKDFGINDNWYFHSIRKEDIAVIKKIFEEGIKSAHLMNVKPNHFNGKYYISLYKYNKDDGLNQWLDKYPKFVINDIQPLYADSKKLFLRRMFVNTKIPLRTSEWVGEYQQYLMINTSKFVALGYDLSYIFRDMYCSDKTIKESWQKEILQLLRDIIFYMNQTNNQLPIYDFSTRREINKEKVLSLHI